MHITHQAVQAEAMADTRTSPVPVHPFEVKIIDIYHLGPWDTWDIYARMFLLLLCINEIWEG
jgi:hypothetical protein